MKPDAPAHRPRAARISLFLLVFSSVTLSATWFVCATWNHFQEWPAAPLWEIIFPGLSLAFIVTTVLGRVYSGLPLRVAYRISAVWMGVLNYWLFAAVAAWIFSGAAMLLSFHIAPGLIAGIVFGSGIVIAVYGLVNAAWLRVTRVPVKLANLPAHWHGQSVAVVADMHLGNIRGAGLTRRNVGKLQEQKPRAIFITGDMFDGTKADLDALLEPWRKISSTANIYYVTGNHEEFTDRDPYLEAVRRAGIRVLDNEMVELDGLQIIGIHDAELHDPQIYRGRLQRVKLNRELPSILLAHQPLNLTIPEEEGISLQVSGHTHGGQFWPWTLAAARVHGRFVEGLNRLDNMQVLTSNGAGTWGAPMRVGTKSEIVLIVLESATG